MLKQAPKPLPKIPKGVAPWKAKKASGKKALEFQDWMRYAEKKGFLFS